MRGATGRLRNGHRYNFDNPALQHQLNSDWRVWRIEELPAMLAEVAVPTAFVMYDYAETLDDLRSPNHLCHN